MIELLVALGILALLAALLFPAIEAAREASRRSQCRSNLHQLGIALLAYEADHGMFPPGQIVYSFHVRMLPYIDQALLFEQAEASHASVLEQTVIPAYRCPSETARPRFPDPPVSSGGALVNYAGSSGSGVQTSGFNGIFQHWFEVSRTYRGFGAVRVADVTDGLSNTAALSEILHATGQPDRLRVNWNTPGRLPDAEFIQVCALVPRHPASAGWSGSRWTRGSRWWGADQGTTFYNHMLTPNQPSCINGTEVQTGAYTAASMHSGGVNTLFADGHVTFISDSVDLRVWSDYGSRNGD